jgi:hypothetical protein
MDWDVPTYGRRALRDVGPPIYYPEPIAELDKCQNWL